MFAGASAMSSLAFFKLILWNLKITDYFKFNSQYEVLFDKYLAAMFVGMMSVTA